MNVQEIMGLKEQALLAIGEASTAIELENVRIKYLSRNGLLPAIMDDLKNLAQEDRPAAGKAAN